MSPSGRVPAPIVPPPSASPRPSAPRRRVPRPRTRTRSPAGTAGRTPAAPRTATAPPAGSPAPAAGHGRGCTSPPPAPRTARAAGPGAARRGRTSVIVTTNLPFEQWTEVLGSERLVGATLDRLTHRCHILEATGESYRLRDAKRRQGTKPAPPRSKTKPQNNEDT